MYFTLAVSCLTISNLPWFMELTFQVPMQYCSLQHWTLLLPPVISTTGCCFCFGSVSSFFLELFLHWSPVAYWAPTDLGSSSFCVHLGSSIEALCDGSKKGKYVLCDNIQIQEGERCYVENAQMNEKYSKWLSMKDIHSVQSLSHVRPHGLQHPRLPCPTTTPGAC